jgi:hypothetical protein
MRERDEPMGGEDRSRQNGENATRQTRVTLEIGPKGKKVVAIAPDWPGLKRGAKTKEEAIARLRSYFPRNSRWAKLAGKGAEFDAHNGVAEVEVY